jgi:hypothetical protein
MEFQYTESASVFEDEECWIVRHVFRDSENRRCTAFYPLSCESHANVLKDALNNGYKLK